MQAFINHVEFVSPAVINERLLCGRIPSVPDTWNLLKLVDVLVLLYFILLLLLVIVRGRGKKCRIAFVFMLMPTPQDRGDFIVNGLFFVQMDWRQTLTSC